jgi:hypothetical protein
MLTKLKVATGPFLILAVLIIALDVRGGVPAWPNPPPGWIGGVIPYIVDERLSDDGKMNARSAMAVWTEATVLRFVPRTDEPDFIHVLEHVEEDYVKGIAPPCARQPTCWGVSGWLPNDVHGLGHAIGLEHEQQRRDRDRYIRVFQEHISPHYRWTWNPQPFYGTDISPYNYRSIITSEAPPQTDEACGLGRLLTVKRTPTAAPAAARSRLHGRPEAMVAVNWPVRSPSTGVRP